MWTLNYILSAFFHFCSLGILLNRYGKGTLTVFNLITRKWFLDKCKEWKHFRSFRIGKNLPGLTEWALNVQGMNLFHKSHSAGLPPVTECSLPHKVVHFILHSSDNHLKCFPLKFSKYLHFSFHSPSSVPARTATQTELNSPVPQVPQLSAEDAASAPPASPRSDLSHSLEQGPGPT